MGTVAQVFGQPAWRNVTSRSKLSYRLVRDGFHALAVLPDQTMVGRGAWRSGDPDPWQR